jgi:hypothetical protein
LFLFDRDESSPVIGKSLIWSNQGSGTPISHPQPESPHFNRPLMSGPFGVDPSGFGSGNFVGSASSMMDAQHLDPLGHHQRMMHQNIPLNQAFPGLNISQMPDRIHPGPGMGDRMPPLFNQQMMSGPMRMGFHPHTQYSDSFIPAPMGREQGRMSLQQQQQQSPVSHVNNSAFVPPNQMQNVSGLPLPRSPHEKSWGNWEEQRPLEQVIEPPAKIQEPVEDFGYCCNIFF